MNECKEKDKDFNPLTNRCVKNVTKIKKNN